MELPACHKRSLLGLLALYLPADDMEGGEWSSNFLLQGAQCLELSQTAADGYAPLLELQETSDKPLVAKPFVDSLLKYLQDNRGSLPASMNIRGTADADEWFNAPLALNVLRDLHILVSLKIGYDARTRVVFRRIAHALKVPWKHVANIERSLGGYLHQQLELQTAQGADNKISRFAKIGGAAVVGGVLIGLTAGAAAPVVGILATSGVFGISSLATYMTLPVLYTVFGAAGAGLSGWKMRKRVQGVKEFEFVLQPGGTQGMALAVCVSGWLRDQADFKRPWGVELGARDTNQDDQVPLVERLQRFLVWRGDGERARRISAELNEWRMAAAKEHARAAGLGALADANALAAWAAGADRMDPALEARFCRELAAEYASASVDVPTPPALLTLPPMDQLSLAVDRLMARSAHPPPPPEDSSEDAVALQLAMQAANLEPTRQVSRKSLSETINELQLQDDSSGPSDGPSDEGGAPPSGPPPPYPGGSLPPPPAYDELELGPPPQHPQEPEAAEQDVAALVEELVASAMRQVVEALTGAPEAAAGVADGALTAGAADSGSPLSVHMCVEERGNVRVTIAVKGDAGPEGESSARGEDGTGASARPLDDVDDVDAVPAEKTAAKDLPDVWWFRESYPDCGDHYIIRWEADLLLELGQSVKELVQSLGQSAGYNTMRFTAAGVAASIALPYTALCATNFIDGGAWTLAVERADAAGRLLAEVLLKREQGARAVTLVAYSMGCRLVMSCLKHLARAHKQWAEEHQEARHLQDRVALSSAGFPELRCTGPELRFKSGKLHVRLVGGAHYEAGPQRLYVVLRLGDGPVNRQKHTGPVSPPTGPHEPVRWPDVDPKKSVHTFPIDHPEKLHAANEDIPLAVELWANHRFKDVMLGVGRLVVSPLMCKQHKAFQGTLQLQHPSCKHPGEPCPPGAHVNSSKRCSNCAYGAVEVEVMFEPEHGQYAGAAGIIENVVLAGAPLSSGDAAGWAAAQQMVAGRLINVYSKNDLMLAWMYRYKRWEVNVAGIQEVKCSGVDNIDASDFISGHADYPKKQKQILDKCLKLIDGEDLPPRTSTDAPAEG